MWPAATQMTQEKETAPSRGSSATHQIGETSSAKQTWRGAKSSTPLTLKKQSRWLHHQGQRPSSVSRYVSPQHSLLEPPGRESRVGRPRGLHLIHAPRNNIPQRRSWLRERAWQKWQGESKNFAWLSSSVGLGRRMWGLGWKPCASFPYSPEDLEGTREQKGAGLVTSAHRLQSQAEHRRAW